MCESAGASVLFIELIPALNAAQLPLGLQVPGSIDFWLRIKFRQLRPVNPGLRKGQMLAASEARCFRTRELNKPNFCKPFLSSQSLES